MFIFVERREKTAMLKWCVERLVKGRSRDAPEIQRKVMEKIKG